ncbi:hypothetical protein LOK49_LG03G03262 [Camellia lanceoleosa]|uniref:Uncharacterized protein n=1 Tax=Camellia lanceoleosa TaxID=1840588 RepID=A0ACC0ID40_9ERIC|nr:hypothetical protein LOK49_LG03G03262 [Camellia lanceoleosa]
MNPEGSSYARLNVYQFKEHLRGNAPCRLLSHINLRTVFSKVSHKSIINIPGFKIPLMYFRT